MAERAKSQVTRKYFFIFLEHRFCNSIDKNSRNSFLWKTLDPALTRLRLAATCNEINWRILFYLIYRLDNINLSSIHIHMSLYDSFNQKTPHNMRNTRNALVSCLERKRRTATRSATEGGINFYSLYRLDDITSRSVHFLVSLYAFIQQNTSRNMREFIARVSKFLIAVPLLTLFSNKKWELCIVHLVKLRTTVICWAHSNHSEENYEPIEFYHIACIITRVKAY